MNRAGRHCLALIFLLSVAVTQGYSDETFYRLFKAGNYSAAVKQADDNIPAPKRDADLWSKLGFCHEKLGTVEKALACYLVAVRTDAKNYDAHLGAARVYNTLNQASNAMSMASKAMDLQMTGEASWEYARACIAQGKPAEAKKALEKVVESDPENVVANGALGQIYYDEKNYSKALPLLKLSLSKKPDSEMALKVANAYREAKQPEAAIEYYNMAARDKTAPKVEALIELARLYYETGDFRNASANFEKANRALLQADDLYAWAVCMEKNKDNEKSVMDMFEAASKKFGNSTSENALRAREKTGRYLLDKKAYQEANAILYPLYKADSTGRVVPDIIFLMAQVSEGLKNSTAAISYLEKAIAKDKDNVEAYARLGDLYAREGREDKAKATYDRLVSLEPNSPKIHLALGEYNLKAKKYEEALKSYQRSFTLDATAEAAVGMMNSAMNLKRFDLARDAAESALHRDPGLKEPQIALAKIYMLEKNYSSARGVLLILLKTDNNNLELWKDLAECCENLKDYPGLGEADKRIIALDPKNVESRARFAKFMEKAGDLNSAYKVYKELAELQPKEADIQKNLYDIAMKQKNTSAAIVHLKAFISLKPNVAEAHRDLGNHLYASKDTEGALASYRAAAKLDPAIKGVYKNYATILLGKKTTDQELMPVLVAAVSANEADEPIYTAAGDIYRKQNAYDKAIEMYQKALQLKPQSFENLASMAYCQEKAGKVSDAILSYEQATAMNPNSVKEQKALGDLYQSQKKMPAAVGAYKKYLEKTPTDVETARLVGDYEFEKKNYTEAIKYYSMITGKEASSADYLKNFGAACYEAKNYLKAGELYKKLIVATPKDPEPLKTLYEIEMKSKNTLAASDYLKRYVALVPTDAEMQKTLGDILFDLKDAPNALNAYRGALKANPKIKGLYKNYVELVLKSGSGDEQISALNGAITANEADVNMYAKLGDLYKSGGNCQRAVPLLEKASQMDPKNTAVLASIADCHVKSGNVSGAVVILEQVTALNPNSTAEFKDLGDLYVKQKKIDQAVNAYKKFLEKDNDDGAAKLVGETAYNKKNYPEAVKYLVKVKGNESKSTEFLEMLGKACYESKDNVRAADIYKQLAVKNPQNAEYVKVLFELSMRSGIKDEAATHLKKYVALKPGDAEMQKTLGDMLYERKEKAGALAAYKAVLAADPKAKGFHKRYVELVNASGTPQEKIAAMEGAIAAGEADASVMVSLGEIYIQQKQPGKAVPLYEKAVQANPKDVDLLATLARSQEAAGMVNEAIISYEQYVAMNSKASKELKTLGDLYTQQKKSDQALKMYKRYLDKNPTDYEVASMVGKQAFESKSYSDAVKYLAMVQGEESKKPAFLKMYGTAAYEAKDNARALTVLKDLSAVSTKDPDVFKMLEDVCNRTGAQEMGVTYLKQYCALVPADAEANKKLGDQLYDRKDFDGALTAYRAVVKADPKAKGFFKNYVKLVLKSGSDAEKMSALTGAIDANEANVEMYAALGGMYKNAKNLPKAVQMFEKASQLDPRNPDYLGELADCQLKSGAVKEAAITYEQAIALNPKAVDELKALGDIYMQQKKTDQAIDMYKRYLEKSPKNSDVAMLVGDNAFTKKQYEQAFKYYSMVSGENGTEFLYKLGYSASEAKDYKAAVSALEKFKEAARASKTVVPNKGEALMALADAYEKLGDNAKAADVLGEYLRPKNVKDQEAAYRRAQLIESSNAATAVKIYESNTSEYPRDYRNFLKLGIYYSRKGGDASKAVSMFTKCVSLADTISRAWFELGLAYGGMGKDKEMLNAFQRFISIETKNADAIARVGEYLLVYRKMPEDAMMFLEMANSLKENDSKIMSLLAQGYLKTGRPDEGVKLLEKVVRNSRGSVDLEVRLALGEVYLELGRYMEAANELKMVTDAKREPENLIKFATALSGMGRNSEAMGIANEVLAKQPENIEAIMLSGRIKTALRNYEDAMETYKKVGYINPNYAPALYERANIFYLQQNWDWAKTFFERALKVDPKYALAELGLAKVCKAKRDNAGYQSHLDKARKLDPNSREIQEELKTKR